MANASSRGAHVARGQARGVPTFDETRSEQRIIIQHRARVLVCIGGGQEQSRDRRRTLITGAAAFVRKQLPLQLTGRSDVVTVSRETRGSHARNAPPLRCAPRRHLDLAQERPKSL
ncbi:unnamed protein product [Lampetra planeri]